MITYIYIFTYIHMNMWITQHCFTKSEIIIAFMYIYICIFMCIYTYIWIHISIHIHISNIVSPDEISSSAGCNNIHVNTYSYTHKLIYAYTKCIQQWKYVHDQIVYHTMSAAQRQAAKVYTYTHIHIYIYTYLHAHHIQHVYICTIRYSITLVPWGDVAIYKEQFLWYL